MLKHVLKIDSQKAIFIAFILFFSYKSWYAMLRVGKFQFTKLASILLIYAFVFLGAYLSKKVRSKLIIFAGVFVLCASAFFITYLLHPNYGSWFFHNADYGIFNSVFYPTAGIYAFLFVLMCDDPEDMRKGLKIVAYIMLIYAVYQLVPVIQRGGTWNNISKTGVQVNQSTHSLGFGYRTVMCSVVFFEEFIQTKKKRFLLLSMTSLLAVLVYGGRGCLLVFILYLILRYLIHKKGITKKDVLILGLALIIIGLNELGIIKSVIGSICDFAGLSNIRTVEMFLDGTMFEDNARSIIWSMAIEMIKTGGIFGRGVYGDRLVIGNYYSWGYSHNIFLEMMVSFGVIGLILIILLIWKIWKYFRNETDNRWKNIFVIFLCLSCQLLVSDSFWYNSWFWGSLALLYKYKLRSKIRK